MIDTIQKHSRKKKSEHKTLPSVDVIIPHFNGVEILDKCLASLEKTRYANFLVTIVDNGTV
ncbi:MAG: hypothetical protein RML35_13955 [Chloroherpetonaceae bacterium]|nr:hypothetical protein [Chloroherpetonaceae bacterium]